MSERDYLDHNAHFESTTAQALIWITFHDSKERMGLFYE